VPGASELEKVVSAAEQLGRELGDGIAETTGAGESNSDRSSPEPWGPADAKNARLVGRLGRALAQIAAAAASEAGEPPDETIEKRTAAALARTELVIRGELMRGNEGALRDQLPGFVFLVTLPGAGMDRALELANRARRLLGETPEQAG
jgi:hypothetical protein